MIFTVIFDGCFVVLYEKERTNLIGNTLKAITDGFELLGFGMQL